MVPFSRRIWAHINGPVQSRKILLPNLPNLVHTSQMMQFPLRLPQGSMLYHQNDRKKFVRSSYDTQRYEYKKYDKA